MALSLKTPSKAGTIRGCCIEERRSEARRYDDARGEFLLSVCLSVNPVGEPDALIGHVRFDERGWETERCQMAQATAPILDLYEDAAVKGISVAFSDLDGFWLRI